MKKQGYVFLVCLGVSLISFLPSIGAGFVYDFLGWQKEYSQGTFKDILHCFGYNGHHQFLHLVFFSFYKVFHLAGLPWYLFFCTLHAVNGFLLYKVILAFADQWKINIPPLFALAGSVLFLVHPYNVEPVVWKVCVHYLLSLMAGLAILILFFDYLRTGSSIALSGGAMVYLISLFTLEISFVTPLVVAFAATVNMIISRDRKTIAAKSIRYCGALWGLLGGYLLFNKLTLGTLVGHYGGDVHLKFDLLGIASTSLKYVVKHLAYARFYSYKTKGWLFDQVLSLPEVAFLGICVLIMVSLFYFIRIRKIKPMWHLAFWGFIVSLLYILPVANIFFYHLHIGMNDRYSYFPVAFLIMSLVALLSYAPKKLAWSLAVILLALNIFLQQKTLRYWHQSTEVLQSLKEDFRWHDAPYVFILNSPDNYKGIVMASIIEEPSGIDELIDYQTPRPYDGKMFDVFQFNMTAREDGVRAEQTGPGQIKVTFNQWGNWWHRNGIGGTTYENEYYKAETLDYPYLLTFKELPEGSVIIYHDRMKWHEFKWN
jgi:hypothetical protein